MRTRHLVSAAVVAGGLAMTAGGASQYVSEILDRGSILHGIRTPGDGPAGLVHGPATVRPLAAGGLPICRVEYGSGKSSRDVTIHDAQHVALADGRSLVLPATVDVVSALTAPPARASTEAQRARGRVLEELDPDLEIEMHCVGPGDTVYVYGCVAASAPDRLDVCPGEDSLHLAVGSSSQLLVDTRASASAGFVALAVLGTLLVAFGAWWSLAFTRHATVARLAGGPPRARGPWRPRPWHGGILVIVLFFVSGGLIDSGYTEGHYVLGSTALLALAVLLASGWGRLLHLGRALRTLRSTSTSRLADPGDAVRELALRVPADAADVGSLGPGRTHAFVRVEVHETTKRGKKEVSTKVLTVNQPAHLQVEDASGRAWLEMTGREVEPASPPDAFVLDTAHPWPSWLADPLARLQRSEDHARFIAHWIHLEKGDPLLVFGALRREPPPPKLASDRAGYRGAEAFVLRGDACAIAIEEQGLVRALVRERVALVLAGAVLLAASGTAVVALARAAAH